MGKYRTTMANILNDMNQKQQTNLEQLTGEAIGDLMENYNQRSYKDGPGSLDGAFSSQQLQKLKGVWANKSTKDVTPSLMKMIKGWDTPTKHAVAQANINVISKITAKEEVEFTESIDEGRMKDIHTMDSEGKSAAQIAKALGISASVVKDILGESLDETIMMDEKFSADQIARLKKSYSVMKGKRISMDNANKLSAMFKTIPDDGLVDIFKADIPFLSVMAMTKMIQKNIPRPAGVKLSLEAADIPKKNVKDVEDVDQGGDIQDPKPETVKKDKSAVVETEGDGDVAKKDAEIAILKKKMETEKAKSVQKMTAKQVNPETGEPLLRVGIAYKHLKDKMKKEEIEEELQITEGKIDAKKFDTLKKGDTMTITYNSMMSGTTVKKFVVKNKTRSAKYNTDKVKLEIDGMPGRSPFYLYKRKDGSVSFAQGDMAATVVAVKEAVLQGRDYKFDGKTVSISKKNFSQVSKDFKNATPGQEKMVVLDPKSQGTISAPVKFTEEDNNEVDEACWDSHKQVGMKTKGGKQVPNCVPKEGAKKLVDSIIKKKMQKKELGEASLYASKEYEPGLISNNVNADMKNIEDAIKRAGGRIKSKEKPTRREPNMSFEIETGNPNAVKAAIKKVDPEFDID
jgi:hypothetical protein